MKGEKKKKAHSSKGYSDKDRKLVYCIVSLAKAQKAEMTPGQGNLGKSNSKLQANPTSALTWMVSLFAPQLQITDKERECSSLTQYGLTPFASLCAPWTSSWAGFQAEWISKVKRKAHAKHQTAPFRCNNILNNDCFCFDNKYQIQFDTLLRVFLTGCHLFLK